MNDERCDRDRVTAIAACDYEHGREGQVCHCHAERVPELLAALLEALDTIVRLEGELDACQLLYIEATNPGIDMDDVKRIRAGQALNGGNE